MEIAKMHTVGTVAMLLSSQPHRPIARHRCEENVKLYFISQHLIIIPLCRHQKTLWNSIRTCIIILLISAGTDPVFTIPISFHNNH